MIGRDTVLRDRTKPLIRSICTLLQASQEDYLVAALRHLQSMVSHYTTYNIMLINIYHLQISMSVKRTSQCDGLIEPKYSTQQAVERKVGVVPGWEELLMATGFHFIHGVKKDMPTTIVYPEHDDSGIQRKCQQQLDALLNIPHCLKSLSLLSKHPSAAIPIITSVSRTNILYHVPSLPPLPPTPPPPLS